MRLGKAMLLSNQLAVHRLELVRPRLGALRNLAYHLPRRRQAVERRSNAREPGPPSFGSKDRSARSAWCSSGRAAPAHPPGRQRRRLNRRSGSSPRSGFRAQPNPAVRCRMQLRKGHTARGRNRRCWNSSSLEAFNAVPAPHPRKTHRLALTPRIPPSWAVSATTDTPELPPTENAAFLEGKLDVCVIHRRVWLWSRCLDSWGDAGWEGRVASWGERSERAGGGVALKRRCERTLLDRLSRAVCR
jgi:hypothetical protein